MISFRKFYKKDVVIKIYLYFTCFSILALGRSGQGIYLFDRRVGEYLIFILYIISFILIFFSSEKSYLINILKFYYLYSSLNFLIFGFEYPASFRYSSFVVGFTMYLLATKYIHEKEILRFLQISYYLSIFCLISYIASRFFNG